MDGVSLAPFDPPHPPKGLVSCHIHALFDSQTRFFFPSRHANVKGSLKSPVVCGQPLQSSKEDAYGLQAINNNKIGEA
ncbi:hypothetical protein [Hoeflea sp.]|uniref:hypothetical protein n=1 Tax=Hoeflea sp. TaxID=1940281 RepID=UPI003B0144F2